MRRKITACSSCVKRNGKFRTNRTRDLWNRRELRIDELPEPQRISIRHFFFEEMSYADIAEATGWHLKSVKSYIQNGKRNLKICIEKRTER